MKLSASNVYLSEVLGERGAIETLAKAGFDAVDFCLETSDDINGGRLFADFSDGEFDEYFKNIKCILDENKISVGQTHAHTGPFSLTSSEEYFNTVIRDIRATAILGARYTVIHPLIMPECKYDEYRAENKKYNMDFFTRLIPYLEKYGVKNGIEPMWNWDDEKQKICPTVCSKPEEIIDYIETLNSERFVACLDIGHINLTGGDTGDTPATAIRKLGKYTEILHVHDTDGIDDLHVPPFMGNIDWLEVTRALSEVGYSGSFNFEVGKNYFKKYGSDAVQSCTDYMYAVGKFLTSLI